ncbi:MAG: hypothetical protein R2710_04370 [Acidimicrobiales bacterium]
MPPSFDEEPTIVDVAATFERLDREFEQMHSILAGLDRAVGHPCLLAGQAHTAGWFARHVLHDGIHHLGDIGRIRVLLGHGADLGWSDHRAARLERRCADGRHGACVPCGKNAQWFVDSDFARIRHEDHPGSSRLYAVPLGQGELRVGDPVRIEPDHR